MLLSTSVIFLEVQRECIFFCYYKGASLSFLRPCRCRDAWYFFFLKMHKHWISTVYDKLKLLSRIMKSIWMCSCYVLRVYSADCLELRDILAMLV